MLNLCVKIFSWLGLPTRIFLRYINVIIRCKIYFVFVFVVRINHKNIFTTNFQIYGNSYLLLLLNVFYLFAFQAAFLLPAITRLIKEDVDGASRGEQQSPQVLIVSPTRELTLQIYNEARKFTHDSIYK